MKSLIIDNGTSHLKEIVDLLDNVGFNSEIKDFRKSSFSDYNQYDLVILSGSSAFSIKGNEGLYQREIDLIRRDNAPAIIGICLGFELIAHAYGAVLSRKNEKRVGLIELDYSSDDSIFNEVQNLRVYEGHHWVVEDVPEEFEVLASSKDGVEIFRHNNRKLYGMQFHPEMALEDSDGDEVFGSILNNLFE